MAPLDNTTALTISSSVVGVLATHGHDTPLAPILVREGFTENPKPQGGPCREIGAPDGPPPSEAWMGRLRVRRVEALLATAARDYLLKGLLSPAEVSLWWGDPKSGKTFLVLHVCYAIAQGRSVWGRRVKQAPVLYLAAEGEAGIAGRVRALRDKHGVAEDFCLVGQSIDLFRDSPQVGDLELTESKPEGDITGGHLQEAISLTKRLGAKLVVVDTLNRALAGGDENSSKDMGQFIANISRLKEETGAHVLIVHHGTKSANGTYRGHGSLGGMVDAIVRVSRIGEPDKREAQALIERAKDDADGAALGFRLNLVNIGTDADGDAITTLVVDEMAVGARQQEMSQKNKAKAILIEMLERDGVQRDGVTGLHSGRAIRMHDWRQMCADRGLSNAQSEDSKRKAFDRAVEKLDLQLGQQEGWVWLKTAKEMAANMRL
jgi:KaiC/GvpD/RAD55 family RecA-like ATPase